MVAPYRIQIIKILLYSDDWRKPSQYVHAQPFFHEDYPAYDMDEEDQK